MSKLQLQTPFPPSVNNYWHQRVIKSGKRYMAVTYISKIGKEYREKVVAGVIDRFGRDFSPELGRLRVLIILYAPDLRTRDVDNFVKPLFDAITAAKIWGDDKQVDELRVLRGPISRDNPRAEVTIRVLRPAEKGLF